MLKNHSPQLLEHKAHKVNNSVIYPFCTPIWQFDLDIDFERAIKTSYEIQKNMTSSKLSNIGGYQSPNIDIKEHFFNEYFLIDGILKSLSKEVEIDLIFENGWVNINKKNDFNKPHCHPLSAISAVLYLKSKEGSGNIVFKNPTLSMHYPINDTNKYFFGEYWLPSVAGRIYFVPSYLEHFVEPNKNDDDRISLALNFGKKI